MDEAEERFSDKEVGLVLEVACEDGVEVKKSQVGGEEGPVYGGDHGGQ